MFVSCESRRVLVFEAEAVVVESICEAVDEAEVFEEVMEKDQRWL